MSEVALRYIQKDAAAAIRANPEGHKAGYYADEISYAGMELKRRAKLNRPAPTKDATVVVAACG